MAKHYVEHEHQKVSHDALPEAQGTLADFLRGHIGVLHSGEHVPGGDRMSEDSGKKFAEGLLKQRQQGEQ